MLKNKFLPLQLLFILLLLSCSKTNSKNLSIIHKNENLLEKQSVVKTSKIIASTSWTAAFADLAGIDYIDIIAPANLQHPPEYEITISDIQKVSNSEYFIFAGFERMMQTLGKNITSTKKIKITCNNSLENVKTQVQKIAEQCGDLNISKERLASFEKAFIDGKIYLESNNLKNAKVACNKNQIYLAKDLGLEIVHIYGPGEITSKDISTIKNLQIDFIIDNIHNPVGKPLSEVNKNAKYILWRNFPEKVEHQALEKVIRENINRLK